MAANDMGLRLRLCISVSRGRVLFWQRCQWHLYGILNGLALPVKSNNVTVRRNFCRPCPEMADNADNREAVAHVRFRRDV